MATLSFEYGPDATTTGGVADTTVAAVRFGPVGALVALGNTPTSAPQAGDDGVREWSMFAATVAFDPAVRHRVEIQNLLGMGGSWDSTHVRRLKVNHGGVDYLPQYPEGVLYGPTDYEGRIHYLADPGSSSNEIGISGDTLAAMWNAQTCSQTTLTGSPYAYWYFGGATVPSACEAVGVAGGWSLAGLSIP